MVDGQKVPIERIRLRSKDGGELPLGSYQLFQRCAPLEDGVWWKMMRGLTTRNFNGTVEANIRLGREQISDERIRWAAGEVHAANFIENLDKGYQTELRGKGVGLSSGQKQLISFARAVASEAPVMILDEANQCS